MGTCIEDSQPQTSTSNLIEYTEIENLGTDEHMEHASSRHWLGTPEQSQQQSSRHLFYLSHDAGLLQHACIVSRLCHVLQNQTEFGHVACHAGRVLKVFKNREQVTSGKD